MNAVLEDHRPRRESVIRWSVVFAGMLLVGLVLDAPIARWLHDSGLAQQADRWAGKSVLKAPGEAWFVAIITVLASIAHRWRWRAGGFVALTAALGGLHVILKWVVGRTRPYEIVGLFYEPRPFLLFWFRDGGEGFFRQQNLSFPSGHTCTAFALSAALGILFPRGRWLFFSVATLTGLQRISENAHYVSDVVAASAFGVGVTYGSLWCITQLQLRARKRFDRPAVEAAP